MLASRSEFIPVRDFSCHVRHWGCPDAPTIFLLHGWMDMSASFQFVADCLGEEWHLIAPDWRGFGLSASQADAFWFPDYLADLDAILRHYSSDQPVNLCGHSLGGNVAMMYAGIRPARVRRLINLEGFGLPATQADVAPARFAQWLDELRQLPAARSYATPDAIAARLRKVDTRLSDERAAFLASHLARPNAEGRWDIVSNPAHKLSNPMLYRVDEVMACWRAIEAPVLWVEAEDAHLAHWPGDPQENRAEIERRVAHIPRLSRATVADSGHMLQHDQPEAVAALMRDFFR